MQLLLQHPTVLQRELNNRSLYTFLQCFWDLVSSHEFSPNWHIEVLCQELEAMAERVSRYEPRHHDLIVNVPPGSTKTITCSIMFPVWCWTRWPWMRFITVSYSGALSLESAEYCRDLIRSPLFQEIYPDIFIKEDKDTKSHFRIAQRDLSDLHSKIKTKLGGYRYSTSVGGTLTGFHGDILIVDDPLNPNQAVSEIELANANRWMEQTLSTRKTNKAVTPTILIMQRLHQNDPTGHILGKAKENIRHICIPGESKNYGSQVKPQELLEHYTDGLMDPKRLPWSVLSDLEADLGQYGYAGQIGQDPTPPGGGMFRVDHFTFVDTLPPKPNIVMTVRFWDKAASHEEGTYTVGVKMSQLVGGRWLIHDVKRGRWGTDERERIIRSVAEADGQDVVVWLEQEPGSGGKESAEATIRSLAGYSVYAERPTGDKVHRADPYSVQVNAGNVQLLTAVWNAKFLEEHRYFPFSTTKDQVDASAGAFNKLTVKRVVRRVV